MQISADVAELLREGLSNAEVSRRTGVHPVKVGETRDALALPTFYALLPSHVAPDSHRAHGTRAKYTVEACRCRPCRDANRAFEKQRTRLIAYGRWNPWVDAEPVRAHIRYLQACGMGLRAIENAADVPRRRLQAILNGRPERGTGPQGKMRPALATAVLAVEPTLDNLSGHANIAATGTTRRLQALVAVGWPQMRLANELGWTPTNLSTRIVADTVTVKTARAVRDLYERLWNVDPLDHGASPGGISRAKNRAAEARWAPPGAWDDDRLDDPAAFPDWTGHCGTPEGYDVHRRHGIPICDPCRQAGAERRAQRRARATAHELRDTRPHAAAS